MSTKPQVTETSEVQSGTIIASTQSDVKSSSPQSTTKAVNPFGIKILSGGSVLDSSFIQSVVDAYCNLFSYHPISLFCMVLSLVYFFHKIIKIDEKQDIFSTFHANIGKAHNNSSSIFFKGFTTLLAIPASLLVNNKLTAATILAFAGPWFAKPSSRNAIIATILISYSLVVTHEPVSIMILSQAFFLLVELRNPLHKLLVTLFALIVIIIGHGQFGAVFK
ncbi:hypothetical protein [Aedes camptorhynchus negev-like virus]|uniref:hypothetical protein n=1 Tax=Aedes camptorhynchus negev-like virus TaxID=2010268 RepID=UPI000B4E8F97|nr:hypothetical protein CFB75_gp4 [Aedes camptorhynchus negev-like virus]ASA47362.1 hypothetical protein [Aedes camptorhynchus negev-like virus]